MALLLVVGRLTATSTSNDAFFVGERKSPWYMVAFGMIGASISGVTFISVPGMVLTQDMTYLQMCIGFIFGYAVVAFVLLPVYYRQRLTTIYSLLATRMGRRSHKTATFFFLLSKMTGAAVRFFLICMLLQQYFLRDYGIPFPVTVLLLVMMIWLYTHRSGIRTIVWTDVLQTFCIFRCQNQLLRHKINNCIIQIFDFFQVSLQLSGTVGTIQTGNVIDSFHR